MERLIQTIRNIFKIPELRRRIFITLSLIAVWRLGVLVPIPGINLEILKKYMGDLSNNRLFGFLDVFSGGALAKMSLFTLGIMPYISASIIFSLLVKVVPSLEALAKEGPSGYRKISQYTRLATVPICILQAFFLVQVMNSMSSSSLPGLVISPGFGFTLMAITALTAGTMFVMWLGEQITEYGIGNGASLIIMGGIIARMPQAISSIYANAKIGVIGVEFIALLAMLYVGVIVAIVYTTQAQRRIPVQYAKHIRGGKVYGGQQRHYLPLRVNQANVMPVIFASALMALPAFLADAIGVTWLSQIFSQSAFGFWYVTIYIGLVFFFSFFWTALYFQPNEMANQLQENGSFIPGIRPGKNTADHLESIMYHVTLAGATFLCFIAIIPDSVTKFSPVLDRSVTTFLGGTGLLIVVGVGLDMMQKIESHLLMRDYEGFFGSGKIRGRR
ncbi:MAG: preprotein translocase subunit SecY [Planctomycetes bacterium]|nr:preprotein translocase subunit SecY [Planctomycetota bacterium]